MMQSPMTFDPQTRSTTLPPMAGDIPALTRETKQKQL